MRISDDRYMRDRSRIELALRFIHLEARTRTIRVWTGLTDDRIRKLYRTYVQESGPTCVTRHRGKSPSQASFFMRSASMRRETAVLSSILALYGVVPTPYQKAGSAAELASVARGSVLCEAFETYQALVATPSITFEHAVHLVQALTQGDELRLHPCGICTALLVADRVALRAPTCVDCAAHPRERPSHACRTIRVECGPGKPHGSNDT
jgi:Flagellar transcriptional activator (FlhC)